MTARWLQVCLQPYTQTLLSASMPQESATETPSPLQGGLVCIGIAYGKFAGKQTNSLTSQSQAYLPQDALSARSSNLSY